MQIKVEQSLTKDEKLNLLKLRRLETESKLKSKLDIYTSVRPFKANKEKEKAQNDYYASMTKHSREPHLDHLYGTNPLAKFQATAGSETDETKNVAKLPIGVLRN